MLHHLLLLAVSALAVAPSASFDVIKFSAAAAAFILALMRLMDTGRPLWSVGGLLPQKLQPIAIALVAVLPDLATGFQHVATTQDMLNVILAGVGSMWTSLRGQLPDNHLAQLSPEVHSQIAKVQGRKRLDVAPLVAMFLCLFLVTSCNGATFAKDAQTALSWIARVTSYTNDAQAYLQQNEAKIIELAPSSVRDQLQTDLDKALADYRIAVSLTGDGATITEDALAKNWGAFATDAEKLAADAASAGLFKMPGVAASNAVQAGASPPPPPSEEAPPLPLIVRHLKGEV